MSTATETATAPARPPAALSAKIKTFAMVFSLAFPVVYLVCEQFGGPLFTYHPAVSRLEFGWGRSRSGEGPAMYWYGWVASSLIGGLILGLLGTMLPTSAVKKIPLVLLLILPTLALIPLAYSLMDNWTK
jgi:hypothetical protein